MWEHKVITISGVPGSGKTTISELLSKRLALPLINTGAIFRELAEEHGMTLAEFGALAKSEVEIDHELDERQLKYARDGDIILEGRLSGWLLKKHGINAFKILLTADLDTRINRIMCRENKNYETVKLEILERESCELDRYQKLYGVNYQDRKHYDLIIDTSPLTPEQIVDKIIEGITKYESSPGAC